MHEVRLLRLCLSRLPGGEDRGEPGAREERTGQAPGLRGARNQPGADRPPLQVHRLHDVHGQLPGPGRDPPHRGGRARRPRRGDGDALPLRADLPAGPGQARRHGAGPGRRLAPAGGPHAPHQRDVAPYARFPLRLRQGAPDPVGRPEVPPPAAARSHPGGRPPHPAGGLFQRLHERVRLPRGRPPHRRAARPARGRGRLPPGPRVLRRGRFPRGGRFRDRPEDGRPQRGRLRGAGLCRDRLRHLRLRPDRIRPFPGRHPRKGGSVRPFFRQGAARRRLPGRRPRGRGLPGPGPFRREEGHLARPVPPEPAPGGPGAAAADPRVSGRGPLRGDARGRPLLRHGGAVQPPPLRALDEDREKEEREHRGGGRRHRRHRLPRLPAAAGRFGLPAREAAKGDEPHGRDRVAPPPRVS